jgi:hypothetical protein
MSDELSAEPVESGDVSQAEPVTPSVAENSQPEAGQDSIEQTMDRTYDRLHPEEVRALWSKREYESHSKISELGKSAKAAEPIRSIAERYRPVLGDMPEHVAFEHLLAAQHMLTTKPREAIKMLAENVGVDLAELAAQDSVTRSRQAIEADVRATITVNAFRGSRRRRSGAMRCHPQQQSADAARARVAACL